MLSDFQFSTVRVIAPQFFLFFLRKKSPQNYIHRAHRTLFALFFEVTPSALYKSTSALKWPMGSQSLLAHWMRCSSTKITASIARPPLSMVSGAHFCPLTPSMIPTVFLGAPVLSYLLPLLFGKRDLGRALE